MRLCSKCLLGMLSWTWHVQNWVLNTIPFPLRQLFLPWLRPKTPVSSLTFSFFLHLPFCLEVAPIGSIFFFFKSKHTCSHHFLPPSLLPLWLKPPSLFAGFTAILSQLVVRLLPPQPKGQRDPIKTVRTRLSFCGSSYIPEWESSLFSQPYVTCPHTVLNPFTALPCSLTSVFLV